MYARLITGNVQPPRFDEFAETFSRELLPAISREHGFRSIYIMKDVSQNKITLLIMWETESDAQDSIKGHLYHRLHVVAELLDGQPSAETFEVLLRA